MGFRWSGVQIPPARPITTPNSPNTSASQPNLHQVAESPNSADAEPRAPRLRPRSGGFAWADSSPGTSSQAELGVQTRFRWSGDSPALPHQDPKKPPPTASPPFHIP